MYHGDDITKLYYIAKVIQYIYKGEEPYECSHYSIHMSEEQYECSIGKIVYVYTGEEPYGCWEKVNLNN